MTMLRELAAELIGMFVAEKWLTAAVLGLIAVTRSMVDFTGVDRLVAGAFLLFGSLLLLVASVCHAARPRTH
jgi:hypothetical protein